MRLRYVVETGMGVRLLGAVAIVNGVIWLLLWLSGTAAGWSVEGVNTVKTNMALCQLLAGAGLVLLAPREMGDLRRRIGMVLAAMVLVIGAFTLSEHLFGYDIGIDQLLASEPPGAIATVSPNRMGPPGSSSLVLVGAGLLLLALERGRVAAWLGLSVCLINLIPAVGFLYGITGFYSIPRLTGISWPTVVVLLSLGAGFILARPAQGPAAQLLRDDAGGILLRRVAPAVIVIPLLLGYLRVQGEERRWYDTAAGTGTLTVIIVLGFLMVLWRTARVLSRAAEAKATAEAKVREREERYRRLFNDDLTGDFISTPDGQIVLCNPAFARMFEFASVEEAIGTNMLEFYVDPEERKPLMERVRREGKIERLGVWRKRRSGAPIYIVENIVGHFDERGELYEVNGYVFDDTERKFGEEALRASEKRFVTLVEQAPVGIFETDSQGYCVFVNDSWQKLAGLSAAAAAGKGWIEAIHPEDRERVSAQWYAAAQGQREFASEFRFGATEGGVTWVLGRAKPIRDDSGGVVRYLGTLLDITERKRAEQLGVLEDVFRVAPSFLHVLRGPKFIFEFANEAYYRLVGHRELIGRPAFEAMPEAAKGGYPERIAQVMETGEAFFGRELSVTLARTPGAKPEERIIDLVYLPLKEADGTCTGVLGHGTDVTEHVRERRRAEEALEWGRKILQAVMDGARNSHLAYLDRDFNFVRVNETYARSSGYTPDQMIGKNHFTLYPHAENEAIFARVRETGEPAEFHDKPFVFPDQPERGVTYWDWTLNPVKDGAGKVVGLVFSLFETTARKRVEEALREERDFSAAVLETAGALVVVLDTAGRIRRFNRACAELTGYAEEEVLGRPVWFLVPPEDAEGVGQEWSALSSGICKGQHENHWLAKDGTRRLIAWSNTVLAGANGEIQHIIGTGLDITERRRAQEALRESQEQYRLLYEKAPLGIARIDSNTGRFLLINAKYCEILQRTEAVALQLDFQMVTHPDDLAADLENMQRLREGLCRSFQMDKRYLRPDGSIVWVNLTVVAEWAEGQSPTVHIAMVADITERKRAEEALERSQARLTQGVRVAGLGIFEHDHVTDVIEYSPVMRQLMSLQEGEQITIPGILQKVESEDRELLAAVIQRAHDPGGHGHFEMDYRVRDASDGVRWISARSQTFFSGEGSERRAVRTIGAALDATERKEAQARLERLVAERTAKLQELVGELEHFSYTITHDMRAPLRAMMGFAEMLDESWGNWREEEAKGFLHRIRTSARRMDALITDALNYSKTVRQELVVVPVDVGMLLRGMLDSYPEYQPSNAQITLEGEIPLVMGNEAGLTQCFSNLLGNAVKFVKPGEKARIRIWAELVAEGQEAHRGFGGESPGHGNWVRIWVEDQGVGIPESMLTRVFDMFTRGHQSYDGTGIGLALVRKVMQRMGGRVGVQSVEGEGSRFWVELPSGDVRSPAK